MYIKKSAALSSYAKQKLLTEFVIVPRRGLELYEFSIRNWTDSPFARIVSQSGFKSSRKVPRTLLPGYTKIPFRGFLLCDYTTKLALISNLEANSQRAERVVIRYLRVRIGVRGGATRLGCSLPLAANPHPSLPFPSSGRGCRGKPPKS